MLLKTVHIVSMFVMHLLTKKKRPTLQDWLSDIQKNTSFIDLNQIKYACTIIGHQPLD